MELTTLLDDMTKDLEKHKELKLVGWENLTETELQYRLWIRWIAS